MKTIGRIYLIIECLILTKLTSAAFKFLWTVTGESVPKVTAGAPILTSVSVTLRISWKNYVSVNIF